MSSTSTTSVLAADGVRAPDFPASFPWLNTPPLLLRALRGKAVLLDFWTYGCINCLHVLPDLKKLEQKYPQELVVISVHSAKFSAESETEAVRNALLRYNIEHPVLVDQNQRVWSEYAVRAWPTLILIDPTGRIAGQVAGEGHYEVLDATIAHLIETARQRGTLNPSSLHLILERAQVKSTPLSFPGKVIVVAGGNLFIADSGHNRIIHATVGGKIQTIYGDGLAGLRDGFATMARFNNPQGMVCDGQHLYVADTNNHAIRAIDLGTRTVSTLVGDGQQAIYGATEGPRLSSPWDLALVENVLYIAMAGNHQIWKLNLQTNRAEVYAGSGAEGRYDSGLEDAAFAQPSGLTLMGEQLFVTDSESSCIRQIDLDAQTVTTIAGGDLFQFGDTDGQGDEVRLQHPLGLAYYQGQLFIADTYNSKIKRLNPQTGQVETVFQGSLNEPSGLDFDAETGALYVADTNNHAIKQIDLATQSVVTIEFEGLEAPSILGETAKEGVSEKTGDVYSFKPNIEGILVFEAPLPAGFHLNREAPLRFSAMVQGNGLELGVNQISGSDFQLPLQIPLQVGQTGSGSIAIEAFISYCSEGKGGVCLVEIIKKEIDFKIQRSGDETLHIVHELREPEA